MCNENARRRREKGTEEIFDTIFNIDTLYINI